MIPFSLRDEFPTQRSLEDQFFGSKNATKRRDHSSSCVATGQICFKAIQPLDLAIRRKRKDSRELLLRPKAHTEKGWKCSAMWISIAGSLLKE
jgi:hypothetical protein